VTAAALTLWGCATRRVDGLEGVEGWIAARPGRPGVVIAAPHGSSDPRTAEVAAELARRTGFGLVVATGFVLATDARGVPVRRYQVNRPLEGGPGPAGRREVFTADARRVYEAWIAEVQRAAQGPLRLYVEIHGNNHREAADRIEVATVGVDQDQARRLRTLLELIRDAHLGGAGGGPRLEVRIEPGDPVRYAATAAKQVGILRLSERALHVELPRAARADSQALYTAILADFLAQAAALLGIP
jgi:hypothetical protein